MAQQLRDRLNAVFSDAPWREVSSHGGSPGHRIADVHTFVVHETSGWPARVKGRDNFMSEFTGTGHRMTAQLYVSGDGTVLQGMQLPNSTQHAGFLNNVSLGSETGHGWGNWNGNAHVGPFTSTDETLIANPHPPPAQIPSGALLTPPHPKAGNHWVPLHGPNSIVDPVDDDLPGIKFFVQGQSFSDEVVVGLWTTARYTGPWRQPQRVPEMLFTEAHYRSWALMARWIAEEYLLPRNFPVLPHKLRAPGAGTSGNHGTLRDSATFSAVVLADEALYRSPQTFGLPAAPAVPTAAALQTAYLKAPLPADRNPRWQSMFDVYRGFHGHGFCGDPANGDHDCPGPMFDWHRFAREVWDWWWYPFDYATATPDTAVAARPYSLATRDGDTPLKEYYWGALLADMQGRVTTGIHGATGSPQTFGLPDGSRVYAVANGELVAARFPAETGQPSLAFMVVRHEVYHQLDVRPAAAGTATTLPVFANRIDYDHPPSIVYTLYMHLGRPTGMNFGAVVDQNPDWLNRVIARKTEAHLGTVFKATAAGQAISNDKWNGVVPSAVGTRPTLAAAWAADDTGLTTFLDTLSAGNLAIVPLAADTTPIRILLGDYLADAGVIARDHLATHKGVRVEIFSNDVISTEFMLTDTTTAGTCWMPLVGTGVPAVRYPSEWSHDPTDAQLPGLQVAGVDTTLINWWATFALATRNVRFGGTGLDDHGLVVHYDPLTFLPWLNARTWKSEWPKYRAVDPAGIPTAPRPR